MRKCTGLHFLENPSPPNMIQSKLWTIILLEVDLINQETKQLKHNILKIVKYRVAPSKDVL